MLKLSGVVAVSWLVVLLPVLAVAALAAVLVMLSLVVAIIGALFSRPKYRPGRRL